MFHSTQEWLLCLCSTIGRWGQVYYVSMSDLYFSTETEPVVGCWFQSNFTSADVDEVSDKKKNAKDASTDANSSDLFSVHNFDVTIDLNFPAGEFLLLFIA